MSKIAPDVRQLSALHAQLGLLEQMLKPVVGGGGPAPTHPNPQRGLPPQQQAAMLEQMLAGVDPQRAGHIRALMAVASRPNVNPQDMEAAVGPLLATLGPQDQGTVRMMLSMMHNQQAAAQPSNLPALPEVQAPPAMLSMSPEVQLALTTATSRAAIALEEARRVAAELVSLKDTQTQTTAAMLQQTNVMRDLLKMLKMQTPEASVEEVEEPVPQDTAVV